MMTRKARAQFIKEENLPGLAEFDPPTFEDRKKDEAIHEYLERLIVELDVAQESAKMALKAYRRDANIFIERRTIMP